MLHNDVWSLFVKGSHAYQLIRKIYLLQTAIKAWNKSQNNDSNNCLYNLSKELEVIHSKLMQNALDLSLWLQEQRLQEKIHRHFGTRNVLGTMS